ncbi:maturation protein [ssRNA phage SRR7976301_12]|uniref:Maturation protein n=1 Tax=ssRNA phage SRR7976301_12 TaxID=2786662 RepID=A0A8S5L5J2_9VIRU|nr:maturation protein [ssRNA phage SRR7976301_12]DAD52693.1 TPA_asm: maturation protein [ssRNA phage SRR7976301_12]
MPGRDRERVIDPAAHKGGVGRALKPGLTDQYPADKHLLREHMVDVTGNRGSTNPLHLWQDDWTIGWFSGHNSSFWLCEEYLQYFDAGGSFPTMPDYSDAVAATMALARTNPSRPSVDVWNFLYELKDIPQMILQVGNLMRKYGPNPSRNWPRSQELIRDIGSGYLGWTFGWDQLGRDLMKLLGFVDAVEKRSEEFRRLSHGSLRRRVDLLEHFDSVRLDNAFYCGPLYQAKVRASLNFSLGKRIWVRVRYKPTAETFQILGGDQHALANSIVFGHKPDWSTIWNAIPWTWLLDWFSTAGDYFAANRNRLGTVVDDIAIMRWSVAALDSVELTNPEPTSVFTENKHCLWSYKSRARYVGGPVITAYVPYLDTRNWSILAALGTKYLRR